MAEKLTEWRLHTGQYLGEISALCFLHLPSHLSPLPLLLAGSGSQMLLYDLESMRMIRSFQIFDGIRVHGIVSSSGNSAETSSSSTEVVFKLAVFGERRVKLYSLCIGMVAEESVNLIQLYSLPKFSHWVLDVCFLKNNFGASSSEENRFLAIGCSDNSIHIWDISESIILLEVKSPERCLLYSMRLWGDEFEALRIASGTIFNEIIVWKVVREDAFAPLTNVTEDHVRTSNNFLLHHLQYGAVHICRLAGHEGSIFRIAWSSDGSKLVSVSDDRSARIWTLNIERKDYGDPADNVVLFGHNARVWDCCIYDSLIITAGEDCTCRAWRQDGKQIKIIKEHIGRGVWRCLYDPDSLLLVTAGFDSAIKVHHLPASLYGDYDEPAEVSAFNDRKEIFTASIPNASGHIGLMDSKSEYVRCLRFTSEVSLYVATNRGYLYHARLSDTGDVIWTELVRTSEEVPIVCMDLPSQSPSKLPSDVDDWIAVGDGRGKMTVVKIITDVCSPKLTISWNWTAELERQLLGTFWCKSLGHRYIFTADPRGMLKLWRLCDLGPSPPQDTTRRYDVYLVAEFTSCFGMRIMCLDASLEEEMLVCGDLRGNLVVFPLSNDVLVDASAGSRVKISPVRFFKGAHGISTVSSIAVVRLNSNRTEIRSTGGDGCICHMEYDRNRQILEFIGMRQVKELSLILTVSADRNYTHGLASNKYAAGFASADFIVWNLVTEAKVVQIHCGGWRRPHTYYLGDVPELKNCFAYVKDEKIYVHRLWVRDNERKIFPLNMHMQFHGRELHSLCFVSEDNKLTTDQNHAISSWIATGCEDGTVRLTRYTPGIENWSSSNLLGEHVGGSAVRSICSISKMHIIASDMNVASDERNRQIPDSGNTEDPYLLISAGAKRVLTAWLRKSRKMDQKEAVLATSLHGRMSIDNRPSSEFSSSISFQWLSSDMPTKYSSRSHKKIDICEKVVAQNELNMKSNAKSGLNLQRKEIEDIESCSADKSEDDWRYLAVTAFLVNYCGSRISVCFVVVACSDATLVLRALILPYRLWFDVALLVPLSSPILALQHVVIPKHLSSEGDIQNGSVYLVIGGATDGSITFWNLTGNVEAFMQQLTNLHPDKLISYQKRPRTGRGSQGGRWWRSLSSNITKRRPVSVSVPIKFGEAGNLNTTDRVSSESSLIVNSHEIGKTSCSLPIYTDNEPEVNSDDSTFEICEIKSIHIFNNVHQSGVNCIHVSVIKNRQSSGSFFTYHVISGGDDQALHSIVFDFLRLPASCSSESMTPGFINSTTKLESTNEFILLSKNLNLKYMFRFLCCQSIASAHSSAVKGVWTDGMWVFSTGLDQRIRCWHLVEHNKLFEYDNLIISVPEPESLDARACGRNHYQIAVAGRGMQIVEFSAVCGIDT